ncbi:MAG: hypothetical protein ABH804_01640 [archaeon]
MGLDGLILEWPEDETRAEQLRLKKIEYARRIKRNKRILSEDTNCHPELIKKILKGSQNYINLIILSTLQRRKKIDTYNFSLELAERGLIINSESIEKYDEACDIVRDYCETGGRNVRGGTGLPKL